MSSLNLPSLLLIGRRQPRAPAYQADDKHFPTKYFVLGRQSTGRSTLAVSAYTTAHARAEDRAVALTRATKRRPMSYQGRERGRENSEQMTARFTGK